MTSLLIEAAGTSENYLRRVIGTARDTMSALDEETLIETARPAEGHKAEQMEHRLTDEVISQLSFSANAFFGGHVGGGSSV